MKLIPKHLIVYIVCESSKMVCWALLLLTLIGGGVVSVPTSAKASAVLNAAAQVAGSGLSSCGSLKGKLLYECVAGVLDKLSYDVAPANVPSTRSALAEAASQLRSAATKIEALSAIRQCQAVIGSALSQVAANKGAYVSGWGDSGLKAISGILARASKLIQTKG